MGKIATWSDLNQLYNTSGTPVNKCPTWNEIIATNIIATNKINILGGMLSGSELVELSRCSSDVVMQTITVHITFYYYDYELKKWLVDNTYDKLQVCAQCDGYLSAVSDVLGTTNATAISFSAPVGREITLQGWSDAPGGDGYIISGSTIGVPAPNGPINVQGTTVYNVNAIYIK